VPQLDIITFSSSYVWFLFIALFLAVKLVGVIIIFIRFISLLIAVHDKLSLNLKNFYDKHILFFISLECFLVRNGSYMVMFTMVLYFYTSTLPSIIASIWLPFFIVMRLNAVVRRTKQLLEYLERRRWVKLSKELEGLHQTGLLKGLEERLKQSEEGRALLLFGGLALIPSSALSKAEAANKAYKIRGFVQFPPSEKYNPSSFVSNSNKAFQESKSFGLYVSERTGLPTKSPEVKEIIRSVLARRTHARAGVKFQDSDFALSFGLTTKNKFSPIVSMFDDHKGVITKTPVNVEGLKNCFIRGKLESQFVITNPVHLHKVEGGLSVVNDSSPLWRSDINPEFLNDPILRALLLELGDECGGLLWKLKGLSLVERHQIIANAKAQGLQRGVNDYSSFSNFGYNDVTIVAMDLFS